MGDILAGEREYNYFKNEKNALPYIVGITELGSVLLDDAGNALKCLFQVNSVQVSLGTSTPYLPA